MSSERKKLILEKIGGIAHLILNNPEKRNAIGFDMWRGIGDAMEELASDQDIRVVIVSGAGGKAFSAGADISEFKERRSTPQDRKIYDEAMRRGFDQLYNSPKFTIAMIDGVCVGGGAEVAMDCDVLIASDRSRFAITPARLGLGYSLPDIERLVRHLGAKQAKEVLATARMFSADEALAMGWINQMHPAEDLKDAVMNFAETVAANAPLSVKAAKLIINEAIKAPSERDLDLCSALVEECYASGDFIEGQKAFSEKRPPIYNGT